MGCSPVRVQVTAKHAHGGVDETREKASDSLRYRQSARNEAVCSLLAKCPVPDESWLVTDRTNIMDRRGEDVPVILDNSRRFSGKEPEYRLIDDAELLLTIYAAAPTGQTRGDFVARAGTA